ncbi:MAG: hypothetical protein LCH95_03225 [Proteobacteria bacterium]|nr:hypothetical protein [Pseudomonadota bacterium]
MITKLVQAAVLVAGGLALSGCQLGQQQAQSAAPAKKPPAADYQAPGSGNPPAAGAIRGICYDSSELATYNGRMLHQQMVVAVLQCQNPNGTRAYESQYNAYATKFAGELSTNSRNLTALSRAKRFNIDTVVTEFANRTAQKAPVDKEFCSRFLRAFDWANSPQVTQLSQIPPVYDLGPDMNVYPCPPR